MFDFRHPAGLEPNDDQYREWQREFQADVQRLAGRVGEISEALQSDYDAGALRELTRFFETISLDFNRYRNESKHRYYTVIMRSENRRQVTARLVKQAMATAKLFETYSKKPRAYSAVEARHKISLVGYELDNLL